MSIKQRLQNLEARVSHRPASQAGAAGTERLRRAAEAEREARKALGPEAAAARRCDALQRLGFRPDENPTPSEVLAKFRQRDETPEQPRDLPSVRERRAALFTGAGMETPIELTDSPQTT